MADNVAYIFDPGEQETYQVAPEHLRYELERGALPATGQQIAEFKARDAVIKKYGTTGQSALGAAEQFASTLTFGGSRVVERLAGVDVEAMQGREEASPNLNVAAQVVGAIAPAVVSGGSSLFLQGAKAGAVRAAAEATAPALATRLGEGVAGLVLPSAGAGILRKTGAAAIGSAAEGALAGAGELVDEAALGNPDLNAAALAHVGGGALLGGVAGGALQFGGSAIAKAAQGAKRVGEKGFTKVLEAYPRMAKAMGYDDAVVDALSAQRREMAAGKSAFDVVDGITQKVDKSEFGIRPTPEPLVPRPPDQPPVPRVKLLPKEPGIELPEEAVYAKGAAPELEPALPPVKREDFPVRFDGPALPKTAPAIPDVDHAAMARALEPALNEQFAAVQEIADTFFAEVRPAERAILNAAVDTQAAKTSTLAVLDDVDAAVKQMNKHKKVYGPSGALLGEIQSDIRSRITASSTPNEMFEALNDLKARIGDNLALYGKELTPAQRRIASVARGLDVRIKNALADETVWNQTAVRQKAINDAYSRLTSANKDYHKRFSTKLTKPSKGIEYVADPGKLETFLKNLGATKDDVPEKVFARRQVAIRDFLEEVKKSAEVVPNKIDAPFVDSAMAKASGVFDDARATLAQRAAAEAQLEEFKKLEAAHKAAAKSADDAYKQAVAERKVAEGARKEVNAERLAKYEAQELAAKAKADEARAVYDKAVSERKVREADRVRQNEAMKEERRSLVDERRARAEQDTAAYRQQVSERRVREAGRVEGNKAATSAFKEAEQARSVKVHGLADAAEGPENFGAVPGAGMLRQTGARALDMAGVAGVMVHPMLGVPYGLYKLQQFLRSPAKVFRTLGHIERAGQTFNKAIEQHAGRLISGTAKAADTGRRGIVVSSRKEFAKFMGWLDTVAADPQALADELDKSSEGLEAAPNTQQAFISRQVRAIAFLASKRPMKPDFGPFNPGEPTYSAMEMAKFDRYVQALQDPLSVMVQAANGSLTQEAVEAVETVDPVLFERMQMAVLESIAEHGGTVPRRAQGTVSMLLKQPASVIYTPDFIRRMQESYAGGKAFGSRAPQGTMASQPSAPAPNPSAEALDVGKRTATATQSAGKF